MAISKPQRENLIEVLREDGTTHFEELIPGTASSYYPEPIQKLVEWTTCRYCRRKNIDDPTDEPICVGCGAPL